MKPTCRPAGIVCNVLPRQLKITPNNKEDVYGIVQHLCSLAEELHVQQKMPRIVFWKKDASYVDYNRRKQMFKMFASMSVMQIA